MDTVLVLAAVIAVFAAVLVVFAVVARILRSRMRRGRFHGIESSMGGSAYMGATKHPGLTPPGHHDPRGNTGNSAS